MIEATGSVETFGVQVNRMCCALPIKSLPPIERQLVGGKLFFVVWRLLGAATRRGRQMLGGDTDDTVFLTLDLS